MKLEFTTVDVFTDRAFGGNPLAVVTNAQGLDTRQMQAIAAEFNLGFPSMDEVEPKLARVREACVEAGREPSDLVLSVAAVLCVGRDDAEVAKRAASIGRDLDELRENGLAGTPAEVVDRIGRFAEVGATRLYLQVLDLSDLDHLELVAAQVAPQL